ncbi:MAG: hypothetical protein IE878_05740 [Epsilonproteobacteria bacterium]|nr:hypothetical protein [Campylobacterota bacterium]
MRNKITLSFLTLASILVMSGCSSSTLSPDMAFKESINKTFDAKGYNYSGEVKLDKFSSNDFNSSEPFNSKKIESLLKGFSLNFNGAVDSANGKEEITYEYKYDKDNVLLAFKFPVLIDYNTQNIYVGKSILNTFLPEAPEYQNKLIKLDLSKNSQLLKDLNMTADKSTNLDRFLSKEWNEKMTKEGMESFNLALKDINASSFSRDDKNQIVLKLNNEESGKFLTTMINRLMGGAMKEVFPPSEAKDLESIAPMIEMMMAMFKTQTQFTTKLNGDGKIGNIYVRFDMSDANNTDFNVGVSSNVEFSNFDKPKFTIDTSMPTVSIDKQFFEKMYPSTKSDYKDDYAFEKPTATTAKPVKKKGSSKRKKSKK